MSLAYADALTWREDLGGQLGDPEVFEPRASAAAKADLLASAMMISSRPTAASTSSSPSSSSSGRGVVVFTGAGISVSSGIPDFRGPDGVWTRQRRGLPPPALARGVSFATARPSLTHLALARLVEAGIVTRVVSQNVDGLHLRSGIPRKKLSELHGNCFVEACRSCGARHERDFETGTVGFKATGRRCSECRPSGGEGAAERGGGERRGSGRLYDSVLDWESPLPAEELAQAERDAASAAVSLCLGTSLQILPASSIPERTVTRKGGGGGGARLSPGYLAIVGLQSTPKDAIATSVVRARSDDVMARVLARCLAPGERLPAWVRRDSVRVRYELFLTRLTEPDARTKKRKVAAGGGGGAGGRRSSSNVGCWGVVDLSVWVESVHGTEKCPLPMVSGVGVAAAAVPTLEGDGGGVRAAARRRAARLARRAAAKADGEEAEEAGGGASGGESDGSDSRSRLASASVPGPSAPFSAHLELEVAPRDSGHHGLAVVVAVALGLGLGADEARRRRAVDAASFAVEVGVGGRVEGAPPLVQGRSFEVSFVSQAVDYGERVEEARREIAREEEEERGAGRERKKEMKK